MTQSKTPSKTSSKISGKGNSPDGFKPVIMDINDISVARGGHILFAELSFSIMRPELIWVTGPNGIGKTTLLKLLAGLIRADSGDIDWHYDDQPSRAAPLVSYLPHEGYAKADLTLKEDFIFWAKINRAQNFHNPNDCDRILEQVGLTPHQSTLTQKLSTGQKRRLSLAKLLAAQKPIWILDEPLTGLDKEARYFVAEILQTHIQNGGIALIASHNPVKIDNIAAWRLHLSVP